MNRLMLIRFIAWMTLITAIFANYGFAQELTLSEALQLAEKESPDLKVSQNREAQAEANVTIARSSLYPVFHLSAVDSFGFAGSSTPTPPEFGGILNSPYRVGPGAGIVGKFTLLDFGNWYGASAADEEHQASRERTQIARLKVGQAALSAFLEAAKSRGETEIWKSISQKIETVEKTVRGFVKTGQYSDVSRLLIQDQGDEAKMNQLAFEERYRQAIKRLALLIGKDEKAIDCPLASSLSEDQIAFLQSRGMSPLVSHAESEAHAAQLQASQALSQHLPKFYAIGSAGYLDNVRLVQKQNYSAWVGVTLPLFEGFRISSEAQRAQAIADERENQLAATRLELDEANARFDETINVARMELKLLEQQHESAMRAFGLAKRRFLSFLGPVVDLREAVRSLARTESQMNDKRAELILALGSKALLNGARSAK